MTSRTPQSRYTMKLPMDVLDRIFEMLVPVYLRKPSAMTGNVDMGQLKWPLCGSIEPVHTAEQQGFLNDFDVQKRWKVAPVDLMHCRLTCQVFNAVATRWIWRQLTIRDGSSNSEYSRDHLRKAVEICAFLEKHPEIAANVRVLRLHAYSTIPTWHRVLPLFTNIRVLDVHLDFGATYPQTDISQRSVDIFHGLLSTPSLHTVIVSGEDLPFLSLEPIYTIKNLWLDHEPRSDSPFDFTSTPLLENVYISREDTTEGYDILTEDIPWNTLRQLAVSLSHEDLEELAESFKSWKANDPSRHSLLTELSIFGFEDDARRIDVALDGFAGQPLTKLTLRSPGARITADNFDEIVTTFPDLVELTVDSSDIDSSCLLQEWHGSITDYARALGKLRNLEFLEWNYVTPFPDNDAEVISNGVKMLRTISEHCPSLVRVNFLPAGDSGCRDSYFSFLLVRDEEADNKGCIFLPVSSSTYDPEDRFYGESWYFKEQNATTWWRLANYADL